MKKIIIFIPTILLFLLGIALADNEVVIKKIIMNGKESKDEIFRTRLTAQLKDAFSCEEKSSSSGKEIAIELIEIWVEKEKNERNGKEYIDLYTGVLAVTTKGFFKEYGVGDDRKALEDALDALVDSIQGRLCKKK